MTDVVQFAAGFNNAGGLQNLPHQPTQPMSGLLFGSPRYSISNHLKLDYPYIQLPYPRISVPWFNDLNTFLGLDDLGGITAIDGTWHLRATDGNWYNFNGTVSYLINGNPLQRTFASWSNVVYEIIGLEKL